MKILIVSQYFWPEKFRVNDLALDLKERGHEVIVLTGIPNYPKGKFFSGYSFKYSIDYYEDIKIYRVPILPRGNNGFTIFLNYVSFIISGSIFTMFHNKEYDKIFAINFSPITAVYPAIVYKKRFKKQLYIWVQDLWPESVSAAGKINSKIVLKLLIRMVKNIYNQSDKVLVQSKAFISSVKAKGVPNKKIDYMPNWAEDLFSDSTCISVFKYKNKLPEGFKIMFAGNIGEAQDFESILKAAVILKVNTQIKWIIIGDGRKKAWVESEIIRLGLQQSVFLLGNYPVEDMPSFFVHADIMLLSLKDEDIFSLTIPSKVQSYLAFGKPILGMLNGIGAKVILDAECGFVANAGDYKTLASNVMFAYQKDMELLINKGENGKKYYYENFSKKVIIDNLLRQFNE